MNRGFKKKSIGIGIVVFQIFLSLVVHSQIVINEFSASNSIQIEDSEFNDYSDWIELYNAGPKPQNLKGYFLTDNISNPNKWQITDDLILTGGEFAIIWADGNNVRNHASFKLSSLGEELAIYSPNSELVDSISFSEQKPNVSKGRITDGSGHWGFFLQATPGISNTTKAYEGFASNIPEFSIRGGLYTSSFNVELNNDLGGDIRYTTDGSQPQINSPLYSKSIAIDTSTVLRARIFKPNLIPGPTVTQTYLINLNSVDAKLPVISIATEHDNFWDPVKGIYVQDFKPAWEIPVNVELFENDGSNRAAFNEPAGVKVNGLWSWQLPQKMLGVYFKKRYGSGKLDYPITNQRNRSSYNSFSLRASGSDWSYTMFRDVLGQNSTLLNMDVEIMGYKPAIVFVNAQYMGIHNIREKVDDDYIEKSFNLEPGTFDLVENESFAEAGTVDAYNTLLQLLEKDLSVDANYNQVANLIDIENFTDYVITEMAVANTSINHNVMAWKPKEKGKWRWILMDVDRGFFKSGSNLIDFYEKQKVWPFSELLKNKGYKEYFGKRLADQLFTSFNANRMIGLINQHQQSIESEIPNHIQRWLGTTSNYGNAMPSVQYWNNKVEDLRTFVKERPSALLNDLQNYGFSASAGLNLNVSPENAGIIKMNNLMVPGSSCSGQYLKNVSTTLVAGNKPGYTFLGWKGASSKTIVPLESVWKYSDLNEDLGSNWNSKNYDDSLWKQGKAQLGYGDGDENTVIGYGSNSKNKFICTYFRKTFTVSSEEKEATQFVINLMRDDGAVVYLNGNEVVRSNIAQGSINFQTLATSTVSGEAESALTSYNIDPANILVGENILAVEIHQRSKTSSDISFDLEVKCLLPNDTYLSRNSKYSFTLLNDTSLTAVFEKTSNCLVPEIISDSVTLHKDCSPYLVQNNVTVTEDGILTIEPGVEILMPKGGSFFVKGGLLAKGTEQNGILFRLNPDYGAANWGILSFKNTTTPSNLSFVTIEKASKGEDPVNEVAAISAFHADLKLDHLTITDVAFNPITARYSNITLSNSQLHSIVSGDLINVKYGKAKIENCKFWGNDQPDCDGIDYDEVENGIIKNCVITDFIGFNSDAIDIGEKASNVFIDSVAVFNVTDKGVSLGQRSTAVIQNSVFINCTRGIALKDSSHATINKSVFYNNVNGIACYEKNLGSAGGNAKVYNSIFSNISGSSFFVDSKSTLSSNYCLADIQTTPQSTTNKIGNPLFLNPVFFDFNLQSGSPGIFAGNSNGTKINMGTTIKHADFQPNVMIKQFFVNADKLNFPEFITLFNPSDKTVDLSSYQITKGITLTIPDGTLIGPKDVIFLTDSVPVNNWPHQTKPVLQWESGHLSNNGEAIQLEDNHGIVIDYLNYQNNKLWPVGGFSGNEVFQLINVDLDNHFPESWESVPLELVLDIPVSENSEKVKIYPNPSRNKITIRAHNKSNESVEIFNLFGQLIGQYQLNSNGFTVIDISAFPNGMLIIKVGDETHKISKVK